MDIELDTVLTWLVPAAVVFGATALIVVGIVVAVRLTRRSPRARRAVEAESDAAGILLVRLDDAVAELDLETGLSGALYGGDAAGALRRARMTAQHARDEAFAEYALIHEDRIPADAVRRARRIKVHATKALDGIEKARAEHSAWTQKNVRAAEQVEAVRARLENLRTQMGDPRRLTDQLAERFDDSEWTEAAVAAQAAADAVDEATELLDRAAEHAGDPSVSVVADITQAERAVRRAEDAERMLEQTHRLVMDAAAGTKGEIESARDAIRAAMELRDRLEAGDADKLAEAIRTADDAVDALEEQASSRPVETIERLARVRDRLDLALGDARSAQQRLRGARAALPGTIAAARVAVNRAEAAVTQPGTGARARSRLETAREELATARQTTDPVDALDAARRAMRHAEDAKALGDFDRGSR